MVYSLNKIIICSGILLSLIYVFFNETYAWADDLEKNLLEIIQDFERHIGNADINKKYYIVVRSFIDTPSNKRKRISAEIEDSLVDIIIEMFRDKKNIIVLERKRIEALEKEVADEANNIHFEEGVLEKKLGKKLGAGFLITGTISKLSKSLRIRAKMIDIITGEIISSSSCNVRLDEIDPAFISDYDDEKQTSKPKKEEPKHSTQKVKTTSKEVKPVNSYNQDQDPGQWAPNPAPNTPSYQPMGNFCCDIWGNKRCQLVQPVPVGTSCFCVGQGWGYACE
ncbi:MAG: hypothetical protein HQK76_05005 [Desulfobacterales bacterium]|nr:hypothetical protein [Desulfobacterales bacterium]